MRACKRYKGAQNFNRASLSSNAVAHSAVTLNYDIKLFADMDTKQFRRIKVPYKFTSSVPSVRRGKWEAFPECLASRLFSMLNYISFKRLRVPELGSKLSWKEIIMQAAHIAGRGRKISTCTRQLLSGIPWNYPWHYTTTESALYDVPLSGGDMTMDKVLRRDGYKLSVAVVPSVT